MNRRLVKKGEKAAMRKLISAHGYRRKDFARVESGDGEHARGTPMYRFRLPSIELYFLEFAANTDRAAERKLWLQPAEEEEDSGAPERCPCRPAGPGQSGGER